MKLFEDTRAALRADLGALWRRIVPGAQRHGTERGGRVASDVALERLYSSMWLPTERRAMVAQIREMDVKDGRVKTVHGRVARDVIRGGLVMQFPETGTNATLKREWKAFEHRLHLAHQQKLRSDARGLVMEGNLALQLVLDDAQNVAAAVRMPSDTIVPVVDMGGRFKDPAAAYEQRDVMTSERLATFAAWQLPMCRLDPDNFDDLGAMGRPWLDACATNWKKLMMTEEDLVIRRRQRAPMRLAHVLEGATPEEIDKYRKDVEGEKHDITTDFYLNRKGGVSAIQGDGGIGDIADVAHLLDTFFAGTPAPKGIFGYADGLSRDILEDLKRDYYDEIDGLQDVLASAYALAFRIHLLFKGIDPAPDEFWLRFAQRRTETPNQVADLALKYMALGLPMDFIHSEMGLDPDAVRALKEIERKRGDPYPEPNAINPAGRVAPKVSVTPSNARKGESATYVNTPGSNGGKGRA